MPTNLIQQTVGVRQPQRSAQWRSLQKEKQITSSLNGANL